MAVPIGGAVLGLWVPRLGLSAGSRVYLNAQARAFVERIARLRFGGNDFAALTRESLRRKFGGGGDVLLDGIDQSILESPERFAAEMYRRFGSGSTQFYITIVKYGESGLFHPVQPSELDSLVFPMIPSAEAKRLLALHEHRIRDEEGNYAEPSF